MMDLIPDDYNVLSPTGITTTTVSSTVEISQYNYNPN